MEIIFATHNLHKTEEVRNILGSEYIIKNLPELGCPDIPETADTLKGNALQKAQYVVDHYHCNCFADDTGLEVDALGGAPGVHSARYATEGHDFEANIDKLLAELEKHPGEPRTARFRSVVTLVFKGEYHFFEGTLEGVIAMARRGGNGFGYDPVFIPDEYPDNTVAELDDETKNSISHRGKALRAMADWLREYA